MQPIKFQIFDSYEAIEERFPKTIWKSEEKFKKKGELFNFEMNGQKFKACYLVLKTKDVSRDCRTWIRIAVGVVLYVLSLNTNLFKFDKDYFFTKKLVHHCLVNSTHNNILRLGTPEEKAILLEQELSSVCYDNFMKLYLPYLNLVDSDKLQTKRQGVIDRWQISNFHEIEEFNKKHPFLKLTQDESRHKANLFLLQQTCIESLLESGLNNATIMHFINQDHPHIVNLVVDFLLKNEDTISNDDKTYKELIELNLIRKDVENFIDDLIIKTQAIEDHYSAKISKLDEPFEFTLRGKLTCLDKEFNTRLKEQFPKDIPENFQEMIDDSYDSANENIDNISSQYDQACQDIEDFKKKEELLKELNRQKNDLFGQGREDRRRLFALTFPQISFLSTRVHKLALTTPEKAEQFKTKYEAIVFEYRKSLKNLENQCQHDLIQDKSRIQPLLEKIEIKKASRHALNKENFRSELNRIQSENRQNLNS